MVVEAIGDVGLARTAHADQVGRKAAARRADARQHVAPQMRGGRVAVQEYDRVPAPASS